MQQGKMFLSSYVQAEWIHGLKSCLFGDYKTKSFVREHVVPVLSCGISSSGWLQLTYHNKMLLLAKLASTLTRHQTCCLVFYLTQYYEVGSNIRFSLKTVWLKIIIIYFISPYITKKNLAATMLFNRHKSYPPPTNKCPTLSRIILKCYCSHHIVPERQEIASVIDHTLDKHLKKLNMSGSVELTFKLLIIHVKLL